MVQQTLNNDGTGFHTDDVGNPDDLPDSIETYIKQTDENQKLELLNSFLNKKNISAKTQLSGKQIEKIIQMKYVDSFLEDRLGVVMYKQYYEAFMTLQLSRERKSRKEIVEMLKASNQELSIENEDVESL